MIAYFILSFFNHFIKLSPHEGENIRVKFEIDFKFEKYSNL